MAIHASTLPRADALTGTPSTAITRLSDCLTRNERLVLDTLLATPKSLKAYEILNTLYDEGLRAPMTIYRALDALIARGLVKKIATLNAFVALEDRDNSKAMAILICRDCQKIRQISIADKDVHTLFATCDIAAQEVCLEAFADCEIVCGLGHRSDL